MIANEGKALSTKKEKEIKFSLIQFLAKEWKKILILFVAAFFYAFGTVIFLVQANTIPSGVSSISQTLLYFFSELKPYVTLIYFALNIPLIIFFWNKVKKQFIFLSFLFMLFNSFWGFILGEFGEPINDWFIVIQGWDIALIDTPGYSTWPIFVYVSLGLLINSIAASVAWKSGASTGGTDIVAYYFSTKSKKDVGNFLWIISMLLSFCSIVALHLGGQYDSLFGIRTICSLFYILFSSFIINKLYPKYKKVVMKIDSKKHKEIVQHFRDTNYWHGFKITESISGYTDVKVYTIETVLLLLEFKEIQNQVIEIDPNAWITRTKIEDQSGNFDYSKID